MSTLTLQDVTQLIKHESVLPLLNDTATDFAENLLAAQSPTVCSYCASEPLSLQDSIDATLRAIMLDKTLNGYKNCDEGSCLLAWTQSTVAIDTNTGVGITPALVSTPEPTTLFLVWAGLAIVAIWKLVFAHPRPYGR